MPGLMPAFPKGYADAVARLRVPAGFLIVSVFAWFSQPTVESLWLGVPLSFCGMAVRAWAAGCLAKNQRLATGGPYAYTRNPLYIGTLLVAAGLALAARSPGLGILFALVFVLVYLPVIQLEEQHLRRLFPGYAEYAAGVRVLWPRLTAYPNRSADSFNVTLYMKNQEYQAAAGWIGGVLFLVWKAWR
jgi:protein-S-isoprenylcysteine O-methyltransferase Ste14